MRTRIYMVPFSKVHTSYVHAITSSPILLRYALGFFFLACYKVHPDLSPPTLQRVSIMHANYIRRMLQEVPFLNARVRDETCKHLNFVSSAEENIINPKQLENRDLAPPTAAPLPSYSSTTIKFTFSQPNVQNGAVVVGFDCSTACVLASKRVGWRSSHLRNRI